MQPPPLALSGLEHEGRDGRGRKPREVPMKLLSINDLFHLTRAELFALHQENVDALSRYAEGSPERAIALQNLRLIRQALSRPQMAPG
jgi:hypothetical protein